MSKKVNLAPVCLTSQTKRWIFRLLKPHTAFTQLFERYGAQGWWPTTPGSETTPRYHVGDCSRILSDHERWEIVVGSILTQNTTWCNAEQSLIALTGRDIRGPKDLLAIPVEELAELIRPSRYYNQKANRLRNLARYVITRYGGSTSALLAQKPDGLRNELLSLTGIGPETADSILLYAGGHPSFVIDAFTKRICSRLGWVCENAGYAEIQSLFTASLPTDVRLFEEYHALLVRHAVEHCRVKPECSGCCLRRSCRFPAQNEKQRKV